MAKKYTEGSGKYKYFTAKVWDGGYYITKSGARKKHYVYVRSKKSSGDLENKRTAAEKSIVEQQKRGPAVLNPEITLSDYAKHWLAVSKAKSELSTLDMYKSKVSLFGQIGSYKLKDLRRSHLQMIINDNFSHPRTCEQIMMTYRQIIKSAVSDRILQPGSVEDLTDDITVPKKAKSEKRALTKNEKKAIKAASLSIKQKAFIYLIQGTGLRREEALALTFFDLDFKNGTVTVNKAVGFTGGYPYGKDTKNHVHRTVPLPTHTKRVLRQYLKSIDTSAGEILFPASRSSKKTQAGRWMSADGYNHFWAEILRKLDAAAAEPIDGLTAHIFRHNYCTELCYRVPEISIKKIAELMGDTEKMVMDVYSHINEEHENVAAAVRCLAF